MSELWDIYDDTGKPTGRVRERGEPLADGEYHLAVRAWIMNSKGEIFITQRAAGKDGGGQWEVPGGAAISGETSLEAAIRETAEETGVNLQTDGAYKFASYSSQNHRDCIIDHWLFLQEITEVKLCEREVSSAKYASIDEIAQISADDNFYCSTGFKMLKKFLPTSLSSGS